MKRNDLVLGTMVTMAIVSVLTILVLSALIENRVDSLKTSVLGIATGEVSCFADTEE